MLHAHRLVPDVSQLHRFGVVCTPTQPSPWLVYLHGSTNACATYLCVGGRLGGRYDSLAHSGSVLCVLLSNACVNGIRASTEVMMLSAHQQQLCGAERFGEVDCAHSAPSRACHVHVRGVRCECEAREQKQRDTDTVRTPPSFHLCYRCPEMTGSFANLEAQPGQGPMSTTRRELTRAHPQSNALVNCTSGNIFPVLLANLK
jgi:hypothetical protein